MLKYLLVVLLILVQSARAADVIVYGGTSAGVTAAVAAARAGRSVIIVEPQVRVGGMISGGLCKTDIGDRETVGGLAKEFLQRVQKHYVKTYGADSPQARDCRGGELPEPRVAELVFNQMIAEQPRITVLTKHRLVSPALKGQRIASITIEEIGTGKQRTLEGTMFVDASYEGDLMAAAGVPYRVGRESRAEYGESFAGITLGPPQVRGAGDHKLQSFNIRGTITNRPDLRVPFPEPERYDPTPFLSHKDNVQKLGAKTLEDAIGVVKAGALANGKFDINVGDLPGVNYAYAEGSWEERQRIYARVRDHWLSLFYMLQSDPDLPQAFREEMSTWGLPKDEYPENGHITPQLYVREARRMIGQHVLTQQDVRDNRYKPDGVCLGSYNIDSHVVGLIPTSRGLEREGGFVELTDPYEIPYGALVPPNIENLLVACDVSATHVAYGSLRMEPVFMMLGQACGVAAHQALDGGRPVQQVDVKTLRAELLKQGALLQAPYRPVVSIRYSPENPRVGERVMFSIENVDVRQPIAKAWWNFDGAGALQSEQFAPTHTFDIAKVHEITVQIQDQKRLKSQFTRIEVPIGGGSIKDITVEAEDGDMSPGWQRSRAPDYDWRLLYVSDGKQPASAKMGARLPQTGRYLLAIAYPPNRTRAGNVPVKIKHAGGVAERRLNQKRAETLFVFKPFAEFRFKAGEESWVEISTEGADGAVAVDAVKWIWLGE